MRRVMRMTHHTKTKTVRRLGFEFNVGTKTSLDPVNVTMILAGWGCFTTGFLVLENLAHQLLKFISEVEARTSIVRFPKFQRVHTRCDEITTGIRNVIKCLQDTAKFDHVQTELFYHQQYTWDDTLCKNGWI